jgi:hypothetical protein
MKQIVVHGLGGGSDHTWSKNGVLWPRDLLPLQDPFQMTAVHSFGYYSDFKKDSILKVQDFSNSLLYAMLHSPIIQDTKVYSSQTRGVLGCTNMF